MGKSICLSNLRFFDFLIPPMYCTAHSTQECHTSTYTGAPDGVITSSNMVHLNLLWFFVTILRQWLMRTSARDSELYRLPRGIRQYSPTSAVENPSAIWASNKDSYSHPEALRGETRVAVQSGSLETQAVGFWWKQVFVRAVFCHHCCLLSP